MGPKLTPLACSCARALYESIWLDFWIGFWLTLVTLGTQDSWILG